MSRGKSKALTNQQVAILKKTFRLLNTDSLANRFYATLFERHPEVRLLFPTDITSLSTKLISVLELVVFSFKETNTNEFYLQQEVLSPLRTLGRLHTEKGVANAHYPIANEILLESIKAEAGYTFPPEAEEAWKLALNQLTSAMLNPDVTASSTSQMTFKESFNYIKSRLFKS